MSADFDQSPAQIFKRSPAMVFSGGPAKAETQTAAAVLLRTGITNLSVVSGTITDNGSVQNLGILSGGPDNLPMFGDPTYMTLTVNASWPSGKTASLTAVFDALYGDMTVTRTYSWQSGSTNTNVLYGGFSQNVNLAGYGLDHPVGETDTTTAPNDPTNPITGGFPGGYTCLWADGTTVGITVSNPRGFNAFLQDALNLLTNVSLLDAYGAPTKTYSVYNYSPAFGFVAQNVKLRFPSQFAATGTWNGAGYWNGVVNAISIVPTRGYSGNLVLYGVDVYNPPYTCNPYKSRLDLEYAPGFFGINNIYFRRLLCGYGINLAINPALHTFQFANAIMVAKVALNAIDPIRSAQLSLLNSSSGIYDGSVALSPWPTVTMAAGKYIFDPVTLMTTPPPGYVVDPSSGVYSVVSLSSIFTGPGGLLWNFA